MEPWRTAMNAIMTAWQLSKSRLERVCCLPFERDGDSGIRQVDSRRGSSQPYGEGGRASWQNQDSEARLDGFTPHWTALTHMPAGAAPCLIRALSTGQCRRLAGNRGQHS